MLSDRARVFVQAGRGGDGGSSFRREAHVPRGGPDGGDGGRGGDLVLVCDPSLRDLQAFRRRAHWKAPRGGNGEGSLRHGADGETLEVLVPPGTVVQGLEGERYDLVAPGQRATVAHGGSGGRGNKRFAGPTLQAPTLAERGLPGQEGWVDLALKLLADVGLVGLPNAGKSSLLARLTRAAPKVADYPFTTLEPALGVVEREDRQLVLADIPGLIEGASRGAGLGHEFLAHIERTRLLVHVLDLVPLDGSDPVANFATVEHELASHDPRLAVLPRIVALSKADLVPAQEAERCAQEWEERLRDAERIAPGEPRLERLPSGVTPVLVTSAVTGAGLGALVAALFRRIPDEPPSIAEPELASLPEHRVFRPAAGRGWEVERAANGVFRVSGAGIERLFARHDLGNEEALAYIERRLRSLGVIAALEAKGFEPGDDVEIAGTAFELDPN
ncbi:MAG: GTPase ObgE [Solirubrobacteraceae bacterium]